MCPSPVPRAALDDPRRAAEVRLYERLERDLGPDYLAFYSVAWVALQRNRAGDGETDFVVLHPERGLLVLEVKGGAIAHDGHTGDWFSGDGTGWRWPIKDPYKQAKDAKYQLLRKLKEHPALRGHRIPIGHGVVFPDCERPQATLGPEAPADITLCEPDLARLPMRIAEMFDFWAARGEHPWYAPASLAQAVEGVLAPTFELRNPLRLALANDQAAILRLTEEQFRVLDLLSRCPRVAVSGGAGTGKTLLALEKARRLAAEGFEVLLTCYNRPLGDFLRRQAAAIPRLTVANFHRLCDDMAREAGFALVAPDEEPTQAFFDQLPGALARALDAVPRRFDALVVDEGQDFHDDWWPPLLRCLRDGPDPVVYVFYDDNQQVYGRRPAFPIELTQIPLSRNLRNTRKIHAAAARFYRGRALEAGGPDGQDVAVVEAASRDTLKEHVAGELGRLVRDERLAPDDVAVLTACDPRAIRLHWNKPVGGLPLTRDADERGKVLVDTIRRFKGLERLAVILTGLEDLAAEERDAMLYVGLSRPRAYLAVVATRETLAALGFAGRARP